MNYLSIKKNLKNNSVIQSFRTLLVMFLLLASAIVSVVSVSNILKLFIVSGILVQQDEEVRTITGVIKDITGATLPGVTVMVKGGTTGALFLAFDVL